MLLLAGQLPLAITRFSYTEITDEGLDLNVRVRRRSIPWSRIAAIELGGPTGRAPRIELTDGSKVQSVALGGLVAGPTADAAVLDRLERAAAEHAFNLRPHR
ncbi:PH domain-containing protein [Egicoccus sp. AB-alg2]|uniref:PH domain-containing protein n=1 Tax=Egicoccus sp. AB-alg2 TaxID=3242693 RepID=UPI00359E6AB2